MYRVVDKANEINILNNKKIGTYPDLSLADARELASEVRKLAKKGKDYFKTKPPKPKKSSFETIANEYIEKHAKPKKRQWRADERLIEKELKPKWEGMKGADITRWDIKGLLDEIVERPAPIQANRVRALISIIFNWAIEEGLLDYNPCQQVKKPSDERERDRVLKEKEIKILWENFDKQNTYVGGIMKLMLLTGQRRWEISHMRWQDIDTDVNWWTIPGEFAKNKKSHRVPLTKTALEIIMALPKKKDGEDEDQDAESDWVFPSPTRKGQFINNIQKAKQRVDEKAKVKDFVLHDLRRTASTYMGEEGVPENIIGKLLNHTETSVTRLYNRHRYDKEKREALEKWEQRLKKILSITDKKVMDPPMTADVFKGLDMVRKSQGAPE